MSNFKSLTFYLPQEPEVELPVEVVVLPVAQVTQFVFPSLVLYFPMLHALHVEPSPPYPAVQTTITC